MADKWYLKTLTTNQTFIATMDDLIAQLKRINARQEVVKKVDFFPSTTSSNIGDKILYIYDNSVYKLNGNREWELYNEKPSYYTKSYIDSNIYSKDDVNNKFQVKLVSSSNIKTINGESILGSGDLKIKVTANVDLDNYYTKTYIDNNYCTKSSVDVLISTLGSEIDSYSSQITTNKNNITSLQSTANTINNNYASKSYVNTKISDLINSAPTTLDTLGEIADAIEENQSTIELLNSAIGTKANKTDLDNYYTKTYIDTIVSDVASSVSDLQIKWDDVASRVTAIEGAPYATQAYVDTAVSNVSVDLSNYYTKAQTEEYVSGIVGDINTILDEINGEVV